MPPQPNRRLFAPRPAGALEFRTKERACVWISLRLAADRTCGDEGIRTPDIRVANAALYQLSYVPAAVRFLSLAARKYPKRIVRARAAHERRRASAKRGRA
jgi:hypothetical protein